MTHPAEARGSDIEALIRKYEQDLGSPEYIAAARAELTALRAKAALADAMWNRLDTINRPLDEYEGQWYVRYDDEVKP